MNGSRTEDEEIRLRNLRRKRLIEHARWIAFAGVVGLALLLVLYYFVNRL
jgi:hypothetical protein